MNITLGPTVFGFSREIFPHGAVSVMLYVLYTKYEQYCIMDVFCYSY